MKFGSEASKNQQNHGHPRAEHYKQDERNGGMTIEDRFERLERQNRRLKWAFVVVPLCALPLVVFSD